MKIRFLRSALVACAALVMSACGGGGSGNANNSTGAVGALAQTTAVTEPPRLSRRLQHERGWSLWEQLGTGFHRS